MLIIAAFHKPVASTARQKQQAPWLSLVPGLSQRPCECRCSTEPLLHLRWLRLSVPSSWGWQGRQHPGPAALHRQLLARAACGPPAPPCLLPPPPPPMCEEVASALATEKSEWFKWRWSGKGKIAWLKVSTRSLIKPLVPSPAPKPKASTPSFHCGSHSVGWQWFTAL